MTVSRIDWCFQQIDIAHTVAQLDTARANIQPNIAFLSGDERERLMKCRDDAIERLKTRGKR